MGDVWRDLATWLEIISGLGGIAGAAGAALIWLAKSNLVTRADMADALATIGQQADGQDRRLITIENELRHIPTQRDFQMLSDRVSVLSADIGKIGVAVEGINGVLTRIERPLNVLIDARIKEEK